MTIICQISFCKLVGIVFGGPEPDVLPWSLQPKHRCMQRYEVLWAVHSFSLKWRALQRRREVRRAAFQEALAEAIDDDKAAIQECLNALEASQSPEVSE